MNNPICYIVGAVDFETGFQPGPLDYVIAADGGYRHILEKAIRCDMVIGDFDSLEEAPSHPNCITLSKIKDDTDMLAAIKEGLKMGYREFCLYGGLGGNIRHTLANIQCLSYLLDHGAKGCLLDDSTVITAIRDGAITFEAGVRGFVSIFAHGGVSKGVDIEGLKYPLCDATVTCSFPIGVSNEFLGGEGKISVRSGTLIVVYPASACKAAQ